MKKTLFILAILVAPFVAFAQTTSSQCTSGTLTLCTLINKIIGYLNQILFVLIGIAVVVFVYYIFKYFIKPNENRDEAGKYVMYSVIGFFVILSMWGLVNILQNTFGLNNTAMSMSQISNLFPGDSGSSGNQGTNIFNQGVSSVGSSYSSGAGTQSSYFNTAPSSSYGNLGTGLINSIGNTISNINSNAFGTVSSGNNSASSGSGGSNSTGSSGNCNGTQMPPNGNGLVYTCQNGNIVFGAAPASSANTGQSNSAMNAANNQLTTDGCIDAGGNPGPNAGSSDCQYEQNAKQNLQNIQQCEALGQDEDTCTSEYGATGSGGAGLPTSGATDPNASCLGYDADGNCTDYGVTNTPSSDTSSNSSTGNSGSNSSVVPWNTNPGYPCYDANDNVVSCTSGNAVSQSAVYIPTTNSSNSSDQNNIDTSQPSDSGTGNTFYGGDGGSDGSQPSDNDGN